MFNGSTSVFQTESASSNLAVRSKSIRGDMAQTGEHLPCKQKVAGSIPAISTNGPIVQPGRTPDCRSGYTGSNPVRTASKVRGE